MKIGDTYTYKYKKAESEFKVGQRVRLEDLAFVVEETNTLKASGKVTNTYNHKRKRHHV